MIHPSKPCFISKGELLDRTEKQAKVIENLKGKIEGLQNTIKYLLEREERRNGNQTPEKTT